MHIEASVLGRSQYPTRHEQAKGDGDDEVRSLGQLPDLSLSSKPPILKLLSKTHLPLRKSLTLVNPQPQLLRQRLAGN